ncbi:MarC family NAAT transporter [Mesosutterella sp. OilRF-GAM-744-9]|uniref:UPF0056 membrane protein n=1 Tax=Mesosutterella porci TaxID=2915351 RepID=A0ABS9MQC6_9BURK|nr:MarC family NAAT transporter [Mesosutterella sp. oilRF-744-WT-GAM-9]MCG5030794.1 MarC family NAAT transporter [Mesosutterella sp. oilRF-744-WT-GAM-9]MCI6529491.1 MarC family NAAT transporter [Mesosutterella sp.]
MPQALHFQFFFGALISLIVITNPVSKIPLFISLTEGMPAQRRVEQAKWAAIYAFLIMVVSLIAGNLLLTVFGISYGAMRIAGGIVVALIGQQMLFGGASPNKAPPVSRTKDDYSFFPLAMPGISGPGTIAVVIGFSTQIAEVDDWPGKAAAFAVITAAIAVTSLIVWIVMRSSDFCARALGPSGTQVLSKIMGFLLVCIGVQFVGSGIRTFMAGS